MQEVVNCSKRIETILVSQFGANGRGLHEKLSSVGNLIPTPLSRRIRYIATLRNKLVHEDGYEIENPTEFLAIGRQTIAELEGLVIRLQSAPKEEIAIAPSAISVPEGPVWTLVRYAGLLVVAWMLLPALETPALDRLETRLKMSIFAADDPPSSEAETLTQTQDDPPPDRAVSQTKPEEYPETHAIKADAAASNTLFDSIVPESDVGTQSPPTPARAPSETQSNLVDLFAAGRHVGLGSEELSIEEIQFAFKRGSFNALEPKITLRVRNNSARTLSSARLQVRLYIPGNNSPVIAPSSNKGHIGIFFGERGLPPGHVRTEEIRISGFDAHEWKMPDVLNASAHQLVARIIEVRDGSRSRFGSPADNFEVLGTKSGVASMRVPTPTVMQPVIHPDEILSEARRDFTDGKHVALGNEVLEIESVSLRYVTGSFGRSEPRIEIVVRNLSTRTIASAHLHAQLFIDRRATPVLSTGDGRGVFDRNLAIFFGEHGLPAGRQVTTNIRVSGHDAHAWTTPDILNAGHRQLLLRLVEVRDGSNNRIGEEALKFAVLTSH